MKFVVYNGTALLSFVSINCSHLLHFRTTCFFWIFIFLEISKYRVAVLIIGKNYQHLWSINGGMFYRAKFLKGIYEVFGRMKSSNQEAGDILAPEFLSSLGYIGCRLQ